MKKLFIIFCLIHLINSQECNISENSARFDCYPEDGANEQDCTERGCCWNKPISNHPNHNDINIPYCYFPRNFSLFEVVSQIKTNNSLIISIEKQKSSNFRKNEILKLEVRLNLELNDRLNFKIIDPNSERYEVPLVKINNNNNDHMTNFEDKDYQIYVENKPFSLKVFRKSTGRILFDSSIAPLIYADQYIQFSTSLVNKYFYGLGEHRDFLAHDTDWNEFSMWNRDYPPSKIFECIYF